MSFDLENDWLPVGSVVSIRFNENKFMIIGYSPINSKTKKPYDYYAVVYPYGFSSHQETIVFNKEVVKKIYHIGYMTDDYNSYIKMVDDELKKYKVNNN